MMVGDSINDITPANILSMNSVFVSYGYGKLESPLKPSYTIDNFDQIIDILKAKF